jgi:hypothetical protein
LTNFSRNDASSVRKWQKFIKFDLKMANFLHKKPNCPKSSQILQEPTHPVPKKQSDPKLKSKTFPHFPFKFPIKKLSFDRIQKFVSEHQTRRK